ncbi:MAG TPA: anti-sigma factor [Methylibium sp.]|uniref:anti-sigma factor n=1 Tax=Methylibium sp. TaxID=2067992 RepID=UPI002DB98616|nr:anti-sigma factor [Methylibium sp.]HEU4460515.1 anti-sigma factor [Methylibium sp.]
MDYGRPALADRLSGEYVLGTLRGAARRRFEALLPAHPVLRAAVAGWQAKLMPLAAAVRPVEPSAAVWARLQQRLFGEPSNASATPPAGLWQRLALWRGVSAVATVAALGFALLLAQPKPAVVSAAPIVVVIAPNPEAASVLQAGFAAAVSADGRTLVVRPIHDIAPGAGRALELWAVPSQGAPRSLGLVSGEQATVVQRAQLLQGTAAFAVTLEPAGGSPTGGPTGPVVSVGKLQI